MLESCCLIIDDIMTHYRTTIKILWLAIIMTSSACFGAGIVAVMCYNNYLSVLLLTFGAAGMLLAVLVYVVKVIFPVHRVINSPLQVV